MVQPLKRVINWPVEFFQAGINVYQQYSFEKNAVFAWKQLSIQKEIVTKLENKLKKMPAINIKIAHKDHELKLIQRIKKQTDNLNKNNITRTTAYLEFYRNHPEIHWALLAHLVSRNGGWNMTDVKGSILSEFLTPQKQSAFFMFLESANALIFRDAYSQLLLYEESKKQHKNLFHLLPHFGVSAFMRPVWDLFFSERDLQLLTVALIINEQHYIEKRVIQHPYYKTNVLNTLLFQGQELFQFTYVLFPYIFNGKCIRLAGLRVNQFTSVGSRIDLGKRLYTLLFGIKNVHEDIYKFLEQVPHTGSRGDYWPHVFTASKILSKYTSSLSLSCQTSNPFIYSPKLTDVWKNIHHSYTAEGDWYHNTDVMTYFSSVETPKRFEVTSEYCRNLHKMQAGAIAYETSKEIL
ncbi:DUF2515 domain-containing protein [Bacillus sp. Marseille-P3661]|uniref:DUF2515 domain-containing protein n=1 Tax=Bacillus sp. Marseille-P3661 TaxID=1936234 RepID=UPI000C81AB9E|nr:DUF2515 domain-containing protein [Bacillus sp. Marseille-P3661]